MKIPSTSVREIAKICSAQIIGRDDLIITGLNEIHKVEHGDLAFVDHPKYYRKTLQSSASAVLINEKTKVPNDKCLLLHPQPFLAFNEVSRYFSPPRIFKADIDPDAKIGTGTEIMPGVKIGKGVCIGNHCRIYPNVVIYPGVTIGNNVIIHSGTVIGSDAFYYKNISGRHEALYSCGSVVIEDNVHIGANCTIDKGVTDVTRIGKHTIIDNLVHIGHDVEVGEGCLMAAQVGIAGCARIGNHVKIWGQAGINSNTVIEDGAIIYAQSGVTGHVPKSEVVFGSPAGNAREKMKELSALKYLPDIIRNKGKK